MNAFNRRQFLKSSLILGTSAIVTPIVQKRVFATAPAIVTAMRPKIPYGVMSGEVSGNSAVIWSRADRTSRMVVEYALDPNFARAKRVMGKVVQATSDFTGRLTLSGLPTDRPIFYRVQFQDLDNAKALSEPVLGQLQIPSSQQDIFFAWGGDTAGQGWGINSSFGGMKIYETMRKLKPQFFHLSKIC
jgi:alkaline phosphatase D